MAKSENPLDQNLKNILESYSTNTQPDWEFMHRKIQDAENDIEFDQKIKQSFQNLHIDSPGIGWKQFEAKQKRLQERKRHIIRARIIESFLFLFLLWTLDNIGWAKLLPGSDSDAKLTILASQEKQQSNIEVDQTITTQQSDNKLNQPFELAQSNSPSEYQLKTSGLIPSGQTNSRLKYSTITEAGIHAKSNPDQTGNFVDKQTTENPAMSDRSTESSMSLMSSAINYLALSQHLIQIIDKPISLKNLVYSNLPVAPIIKPQVLKSNWLMAQTGVTLNTIQSPSFLDGGNTYQHQLRPGIKSSLSFGIEARQWMMESGLIYSFLSYEPNLSETLGSFENGYYKIKFDRIQSHILSIPIILHRQILHGTNWAVSAKMGLSISAALKNYFTLDTITNLSGQIQQGIAYGTKDKSVIDARVRNSENQGLLDGGTFGINSFANLVAGIRYNRQLNSFMNIFSEIELNSMLGPKRIGEQANGFGPNADRIIATNINIGIAYRL